MAIVLVSALLAQAFSLALHPHRPGTLAAHPNPRPNSGTPEPGAEPSGVLSRRGTFHVFLTHGITVAVDALVPKDSTTGHSGGDMHKTAWQASPYYRDGLHFHHWTRAKAARKARRYDLLADLHFDATWHPRAARVGYWLGRLVFLWIALGIMAGYLLVAAASPLHHPRSR